MKHLAVIILFILSLDVQAQQLLVNPYLQDASPSSMTVMWEADGQYASFLEWGATTSLGDSVTPSSEVGFITSYVYTGSLTGLEGNTQYYYRVNCGGTVSSIYDFITPAVQSEEEGFNLAAVIPISFMRWCIVESLIIFRIPMVLQ